MPKSLQPKRNRRRADRAKKAGNKDREKQLPKFQAEISADSVLEAVAKLYGLGFTRAKIARSMASVICPGSVARNEEQLVASARSKLRRWEGNQEFRDMVYKYAVEKLDIETPAILRGLAGAAKKGRVDAAKLALEITGRHTSKDGVTGPIEITLAPIPRPEVNEDKRGAPQMLDSAEFRGRRKMLEANEE